MSSVITSPIDLPSRGKGLIISGAGNTKLQKAREKMRYVEEDSNKSPAPFSAFFGII